MISAAPRVPPSEALQGQGLHIGRRLKPHHGLTLVTHGPLAIALALSLGLPPCSRMRLVSQTTTSRRVPCAHCFVNAGAAGPMRIAKFEGVLTGSLRNRRRASLARLSA